MMYGGSKVSICQIYGICHAQECPKVEYPREYLTSSSTEVKMLIIFLKC